MTLDFEIRPEAVWDNGQAITGKDVAFSLKVMKTPSLDNVAIRTYFEFIRKIEIDKENPKKLKLTCNIYHVAEGAMSDIPIIPSSS